MFDHSIWKWMITCSPIRREHRTRMVEAFIDQVGRGHEVGERTAVVRCILKNGFELVESSARVDPRNYPGGD